MWDGGGGGLLLNIMTSILYLIDTSIPDLNATITHQYQGKEGINHTSLGARLSHILLMKIANSLNHCQIMGTEGQAAITWIHDVLSQNDSQDIINSTPAVNLS